MKQEDKLLQEAIEFNKQKKFNATINLLSDQLLEKINNSDLYAEKAQAYWRLKNYEQCELMANKSLLINSNNSKAHHYLGNVYHNKNENDKAIEYYEKAIQLDPNYAYPYHVLGNVYLDIKEYDKAIEYYQKAIHSDPNFAFPYNGLGNVYRDKKEHEKAIEYYEKAILSDPNFDYPYNGLGNVYRDKKENDKAIEYYGKAIQLDPNDAFSYNGLGNAYSDKNEYDKAIEKYEKAIQLDPNYASPYNGLGNVYFDKENYDKAIEYYDKAIQLNPEYSSAYHNLGIVYSNKKDYDKAIEYYDKAIQLDSNLVVSYYCRADVYFEQNKLEDSLKDYETYISLTKEKSDIYYSFTIDRIEIIRKKINSKDFEKISNLVSEIKIMLLYGQECITHYTGMAIAKELIINSSKLRLSEGTFLNDTSEGKELFNYLNINKNNSITFAHTAEIFTQKPFIGSFVAETKHNDLTLWRMYGKEGKEEAKGCAITLNKELLIQSIKEALAPQNKSEMDNRIVEEFSFYKVAYLKGQQFILADATKDEQNSLNDAMQSLVKAIEDFEAIPNKNKEYKKDIIEELNKIAYLFKSAEYQHENEVRLVVNIDYEKKIDQDYTPPKVYIELVPIPKSITKITIGPKVERADEWAAAFYHHLDKKRIKPEINISHLPFK